MSSTELALIPSLGMGHLSPMVELAKVILHRNELLSISILVIKTSMDFGAKKYIDSVTAASDSGDNSGHPRLRFVDLSQYADPDAAELPFNPENFLFDFIENHKPHVKRFLQCNYTFSASASTDGVVDVDVDRPRRSRLAGFVVDMFCTTMMDVADEFGVPTYLFFASSVGFLGLSLHFQSLKHEHREDTSKYKNSDEELSVPCFSNPVPAKVLPSPMYEKYPSANLFFDCVRRFRETKGILVNSFVELEHYALHALDSGGCGPVPPVYPVGPVLSLDGNKSDQSPESESIIKWLDGQPESSVVFLCFGSFGSFEEDQVKEIAEALELTGHRFLWSLRRRPPKGKMELPGDYEDPAEVLPEGFLERTKEIGKVIGWAPQGSVLSHPAVGSFVSHCGWNSILESVWCGVPIATWPLYAEQQINAFELVKELGIASEVKMDYNVGVMHENERVKIVTAQEIRNWIMEIMNNNGDINGRVNEMKEKSWKAVMKGGSSYTALNSIIKAVLDDCNELIPYED